jgi:putative transposase
MSTHHRKQKKTYNEPGHAHYLTFSCFDRLPLLGKDRTRNWFLEAIDTARTRHDLMLVAYVIMPEHAHLLVWPRKKEYNISRFLYDVKRPVSIQARQWLETHGGEEWLRRLTVKRGGVDTFRFWLPGGGYDKNIVRREDLWHVAKYIHENPVRRELVPRTTDWAWSSARFWAGDKSAPLQMEFPDA